jgi:hypothetical protein
MFCVFLFLEIEGCVGEATVFTGSSYIWVNTIQSSHFQKISGITPSSNSNTVCLISFSFTVKVNLWH